MTEIGPKKLKLLLQGKIITKYMKFKYFYINSDEVHQS